MTVLPHSHARCTHFKLSAIVTRRLAVVLEYREYNDHRYERKDWWGGPRVWSQSELGGTFYVSSGVQYSTVLKSSPTMWQPHHPLSHHFVRDSPDDLWLENTFEINFQFMASEAMNAPWTNHLYLRLSKSTVGAWHHRRSVWREVWELGASLFSSRTSGEKKDNHRKNVGAQGRRSDASGVSPLGGGHTISNWFSFCGAEGIDSLVKSAETMASLSTGVPLRVAF